VLAMSLGHLQQLSSKGNGQFTEKIREAQDLLQRVTQEIRTPSYLLHPPLLEETGITAALRWYIEGLAQRTSLKIELHIPDNFERLPPETELAMFRIVQESLTNVLRHAGSDIAIIRISREPDEVTVEIEDHGKGISEEKLAAINQGGSGVGICGMRDRVRHLGGQMQMNSTPSGTIVSFKLPAGRSLSDATESGDLSPAETV